jgi:hypothetical protein
LSITTTNVPIANETINQSKKSQNNSINKSVVEDLSKSTNTQQHSPLSTTKRAVTTIVESSIYKTHATTRKATTINEISSIKSDSKTKIATTTSITENTTTIPTIPVISNIPNDINVNSNKNKNYNDPQDVNDRTTSQNVDSIVDEDNDNNTGTTIPVVMGGLVAAGVGILVFVKRNQVTRITNRVATGVTRTLTRRNK